MAAFCLLYKIVTALNVPAQKIISGRQSVFLNNLIAQNVIVHFRRMCKMTSLALMCKNDQFHALEISRGRDSLINQLTINCGSVVLSQIFPGTPTRPRFPHFKVFYECLDCSISSLRVCNCFWMLFCVLWSPEFVIILFLRSLFWLLTHSLISCMKVVLQNAFV